MTDLDEATADLTRTTGVTWSTPAVGRLAGWDYRIVFSVEGPPFFEIIQGPPGSPWDTTTTGPHFHHLGYWAGDVATDKQHLDRCGAPLEFDSCPYGRSFTYHRLDSIGARLELVDTSVQAAFLDTWGPAAPMPALNLASGQDPTS